MIKIYSFASNRPDFIGLQLHSFKKHLKDPFEFIVFNNAQYDSTGGADYQGLHNAGKENGIQVIDIQKDQDLINRCQVLEPSCSLFSHHHGTYSNANVAHAYAFNWAWENYMLKEKGPIAIFDSDVFLIQPISLIEVLGQHQICCIQDGKPHPDGRAFHYMWPTFVVINMATLPDPQTLNWWCGRIEDVPVDVGGQSHWYFKSHPDLDVYYVKRLNSYYLNIEDQVPFSPSNYDEFYPAGITVLHYRSGSDWDHKGIEYHAKKTEWLKKRINEGQ